MTVKVWQNYIATDIFLIVALKLQIFYLAPGSPNLILALTVFKHPSQFGGQIREEAAW